MIRDYKAAARTCPVHARPSRHVRNVGVFVAVNDSFCSDEIGWIGRSFLFKGSVPIP
jgi:hypothetical protein